MISYLNSNSTDYLHTGHYNPSDKALPPVMEMENSWEEYKERVKRYINAPNTAEVVIVSGASEACATCMNWVRCIFGEGTTVWGSTFDHDVIEMNAKNYGLKYSRSSRIPDDTTAVVMTHVDSKTGEIFDVDRCVKIVNNANLTYQPLIFLDVSQSITKIPVNMKRANANCVFWSLHKIGGEIGTGIMVIDDREGAPFKPLICGHQQSNFRGGTYNLESVLSCDFFSIRDNIDDRKIIWESGLQYLQKNGMNVYVPRTKHLYNTYLINIGRNCPLRVINALAELYNIYIGTSSACKAEEMKKPREKRTTDEYIRISFKYGNEISFDILEKVCEVVKAIMEDENWYD